MRSSTGIARKRQVKPFSVEWFGGKLFGIRVGNPRTAGEWLELSHQVRRASTRSTEKVVVCADLRGVKALPEDGELELVRSMQEVNDRLLRSAILVGMASDVALRMERLLGDAGSPARKVCRDSAEVKAWLSSSLDRNDREALDRFLSGTLR